MDARYLTAGDVCAEASAVAFGRKRLSDAACLMRDRNADCLVVVDEADRGPVVIGLLTDRDIVSRVIARGDDARLLSVAEAMTREPAVAHEGDPVLAVLETMRRKGVRHMPVVGRGGVLVGVVRRDEVLQRVADGVYGGLAAGERSRSQRQAA